MEVGVKLDAGETNIEHTRIISIFSIHNVNGRKHLWSSRNHNKQYAH